MGPRRPGRPEQSTGGLRRPTPARNRRRPGLVIGALTALLLHLAAFLALGGGASILQADLGPDLVETVLGGLIDRVGDPTQAGPSAPGPA